MSITIYEKTLKELANSGSMTDELVDQLPDIRDLKKQSYVVQDLRKVVESMSERIQEAADDGEMELKFRPGSCAQHATTEGSILEALCNYLVKHVLEEAGYKATVVRPERPNAEPYIMIYWD